MPTEYLFAYGTLQPGLAPAAVRPAADQLTLIGNATAAGRLYHLGSYPGAVFEGRETIHGRVLALPPDPAAVLAALDAYEGVPDLYLRRPVTVTLSDGRPLTCWAYQYNRPTAGRPPIPSGRFDPDPSPP